MLFIETASVQRRSHHDLARHRDLRLTSAPAWSWGSTGYSALNVRESLLEDGPTPVSATMDYVLIIIAFPGGFGPQRPAAGVARPP